jgi:hypothetical protein
LFGEGTVSAAEVEDLFAGLRVEEVYDCGGEGSDEASIRGVRLGVPDLAGSFASAHRGIVCLSGEMREDDKKF